MPERRTFTAGALLFCAGDPASECFVVEGGQVEILGTGPDGAMTLAIIGAGEIVGEMALLDGKPRSATAIAKTDIQVLVLDRAGLEALAAAEPRVAIRLARNLAQRIADGYGHLETLSIESSSGRLAATLLRRSKPSLGGPPTTVFGSAGASAFANVSIPDADRILRDWARLGYLRLFNDRIEIIDSRPLRLQVRTGTQST